MRITSLSHGKYNVGRMAAQLLFRLMNGEDCQSEVRALGAGRKGKQLKNPPVHEDRGFVFYMSFSAMSTPARIWKCR